MLFIFDIICHYLYIIRIDFTLKIIYIIQKILLNILKGFFYNENIFNIVNFIYYYGRPLY